MQKIVSVVVIKFSNYALRNNKCITPLQMHGISSRSWTAKLCELRFTYVLAHMQVFDVDTRLYSFHVSAFCFCVDCSQ